MCIKITEKTVINLAKLKKKLLNLVWISFYFFLLFFYVSSDGYFLIVRVDIFTAIRKLQGKYSLQINIYLHSTRPAVTPRQRGKLVLAHRELKILN